MAIVVFMLRYLTLKVAHVIVKWACQQLRKMSKLVSSMSHEFGSSPIKSDLDGSYMSPIKEVVEVTDSTPVKTPPSPIDKITVCSHCNYIWCCKCMCLG